MALNIKDPEADALVRRLATVTGESITDAIKLAARESLDRHARARGKASLEELQAIIDRIASQPVIDDRSSDEIIGYDENGLPT